MAARVWMALEHTRADAPWGLQVRDAVPILTIVPATRACTTVRASMEWQDFRVSVCRRMLGPRVPNTVRRAAMAPVATTGRVWCLEVGICARARLVFRGRTVL